MEPLTLRLATALAIGLIVGVERGWQERREPAGSRTAGVRTYGLCGLLGGVFAELATVFQSPLLLAAGALMFAATFAAFKWREMRDEKNYSITGLIAALLVFGLGALAVAGEPRIAGAAGIATAGLLASRQALHGAVRRLTWVELRSALVLLAMTVIVLPLLPDRALDPFGAINPRELWTFMVLTAAISFLGYVAVKVAGPEKGILFSALGGALVSSTAVTLAFARRSAAGEDARLLAGGAALAAMVSILRVLVICALIGPSLVPLLAPAAGAGALMFGAAGLLMTHRAKGSANGDETLGNPFDIGPLLAFAALFAAVSLISAVLLQWVGPDSLYLVSAVAGTVDVDVPSLNAARLASTGFDPQAAALAVLIALGVNALGRVGFAAAAGTRAFALRLLLATAGAIAVAGAVFALVRM